MSLLTKLCSFFLLNSLLPPPVCLIQVLLIAPSGCCSSLVVHFACNLLPDGVMSWKNAKQHTLTILLTSSLRQINWFAAAGTPKQTHPLHFHKPGTTAVTTWWCKLTLQTGNIAQGASTGVFQWQITQISTFLALALSSCLLMLEEKEGREEEVRSGHRRCSAAVFPPSLPQTLLISLVLC